MNFDYDTFTLQQQYNYQAKLRTVFDSEMVPSILSITTRWNYSHKQGSILHLSSAD